MNNSRYVLGFLGLLSVLRILWVSMQMKQQAERISTTSLDSLGSYGEVQMNGSCQRIYCDCRRPRWGLVRVIRNVIR